MMSPVDLPLITSIDEVQWPPITASVPSIKLALLFEMEQIQWLPIEKIRSRQFSQLARLLSHASQNVPYYADVLTDQSFDPSGLEAGWSRIPILTRSDVQSAGHHLRTRSLPKSHGKAAVVRTSGSTGKPVEALSTGVNQLFWDVFTLRDHLWHRRDFSRKLGVIRFSLNDKARPPDGIESLTWGRATKGLVETGMSHMLSILSPISSQVQWLNTIQPEYLLTHPSVLSDLVDACENGELDIPSLVEVRTISEALPETLRQRCQDALGVKLVDVYSTIELGYLALQCPEHDHYHVQAEGVLLEVLDDDNNPCQPGEIGRVVVTNLHNFAFPFIRYEVGDYAEVGEPCACGRGLPVLKRIIGRFRNLMTTPDGQRKYPQLGIQDLHEIAPVQQMQAFQNSLHEIEINLVLPRPLTENEETALETKFREMLGDCFNFTIKQVEQVRRSPSGKFEEFISRL